MTFIDEFEVQLVDAARRQRDRRLRNRLARWFGPPRRRGAVVALAALMVGVPAGAATVGGWDPFGDDAGRNPRFPPPSVSRSAPPAELTGALGVLRRPQNDADRGQLSTGALRKLDDQQVDGVKVNFVRLLDKERGIVLVPVDRWGPPAAKGAPPPPPGVDPSAFDNGICIYTRTGDGFSGLSCGSARKLRAGYAITSSGGGVAGLVPDGVAQVRLGRGKDVATLPVRDNLFVGDGPAPQIVEWLADDGRVIKRIDLTAPQRTPIF